MHETVGYLQQKCWSLRSTESSVRKSAAIERLAAAGNESSIRPRPAAFSARNTVNFQQRACKEYRMRKMSHLEI